MFGNPFLQSVAEDIVRKFQDDLSDLIVVFPNNRAQLFFNDYLLNAISENGKKDHPIWSPSYTTIQALFQSHSSLQIADSIKLVCLLYTIYMEILNEQPTEQDDFLREETLDSFYHWGEILLSDFEDVDNNLVDAHMLFQNIKDRVPYEIDDAYLTEEQRETLKRFFAVFDDGNDTKLKRRFLSLWNLLGALYDRFKAKLLSEKIAYEGMLKREVVESFDETDILSSNKTYVFVGFNVLNKCEQKLFHKLHSAHKALFYWDCDDFYIGGKDDDRSKRFREAGLFMRENLSNFPNELSTFDLLGSKKRKIEIIGSATENAQARYVSSFLQQKRKEKVPDEDSVVVLCNESLLLPVLHSIPEFPDEDELLVNVTMGLPIVQTPIYGMMQLLLAFQERLAFLNVHDNFSLLSTTITPLIHNYYLRMTFPSLVELNHIIIEKNWRYLRSEDLRSKEDIAFLFQRCDDSRSLLIWLLEIVRRVAVLFREEESDEEEKKQEKTDEKGDLCNDLYKESLYRMYTILTRLSSLLDEGVLNLEFSMMLQLIQTMLTSTSVPFTGNQILGTQVMGFLETRNLDFSNVILLSANEGILPKSGKENSFIPYALRKGYGMTTIEHKNSLYAYYFYRLLQRAENVTLMYNSSADHSTKGQMSRFLLQLMVEMKNNKIIRHQIASEVPKNESSSLVVPKTPEIIKKLRDKYDKKDGGTRLFSPSSLNNLIDCPLRFYFEKILDLKRPEEITDDVKANEFGSIFHAAMQYFYEDLNTEVKSKRRIINSTDFPDFMLSDNEGKDITKTKEYNEFYDRIKRYVNRAFRDCYFFARDEKETMPEMSGLQLMNRDAIIHQMIKMLTIDARYAPFSIIGTEQDCSFTLPVTLNDSTTIEIGSHGVIDRLDEKEGVIRVLDYKTGGKAESFASALDLFEPKEKRYNYGLQVLLYSLFYSENNGSVKVKPAIAFLKTCSCPEDLNVLIGKDKNKSVLENANEYFAELKTGLEETMKKLFDPEVPFEGRRSEKNCGFCDFKSICGVKIK